MEPTVDESDGYGESSMPGPRSVVTSVPRVLVEHADGRFGVAPQKHVPWHRTTVWPFASSRRAMWKYAVCIAVPCDRNATARPEWIREAFELGAAGRRIAAGATRLQPPQGEQQRGDGERWSTRSRGGPSRAVAPRHPPLAGRHAPAARPPVAPGRVDPGPGRAAPRAARDTTDTSGVTSSGSASRGPPAPPSRCSAASRRPVGPSRSDTPAHCGPGRPCAPREGA